MGCGGCGYESASGQARWLNRDPSGETGGINLYGFNGSSPVNSVDPYGLAWAVFAPAAWGQLAHDIFIGDQPPQTQDPNSLQALQNSAGVGNTPLTDANGNQITPNQALGQMAQDALANAAQLAAMAAFPEGEGMAAADDAAAAAKAAKAASKCVKASEKTAKAMARQIGKDLGKDAQRAFHDAKEPGSGDRTMEQLKADAQALYQEDGVPLPKWMQ
jgi:hypothetical protein